MDGTITQCETELRKVLSDADVLGRYQVVANNIKCFWTEVSFIFAFWELYDRNIVLQ